MEYLRQELTTNLIIRLRADGILETITRPDWSGQERVDLAKENMAAIVRISQGALHPTLNYLPDHEVTNEAQDYYQQHEPAALASAMVARSMMSVLLGNIFLTFKKLKIPTKLFNNSEDAIQWLHGQRRLSERKKKSTIKVRNS
jgi:hypothetical protein